MSIWLDFLPLVIYILLIIVLLIGIILGIKTIITLDKIENVVEDVKAKVQTLNGFFHIIDYTTDKITLATDKVVDAVTGFISKMLFSKKKKKNKKIEEGDINE